MNQQTAAPPPPRAPVPSLILTSAQANNHEINQSPFHRSHSRSPSFSSSAHYSMKHSSVLSKLQLPIHSISQSNTSESSLSPSSSSSLTHLPLSISLVKKGWRTIREDGDRRKSTEEERNPQLRCGTRGSQTNRIESQREKLDWSKGLRSYNSNNFNSNSSFFSSRSVISPSTLSTASTVRGPLVVGGDRREERKFRRFDPRDSNSSSSSSSSLGSLSRPDLNPSSGVLTFTPSLAVHLPSLALTFEPEAIDYNLNHSHSHSPSHSHTTRSRFGSQNVDRSSGSEIEHTKGSIGSDSRLDTKTTAATIATMRAQLAATSISSVTSSSSSSSFSSRRRRKPSHSRFSIVQANDGEYDMMNELFLQAKNEKDWTRQRNQQAINAVNAGIMLTSMSARAGISSREREKEEMITNGSQSRSRNRSRSEERKEELKEKEKRLMKKEERQERRGSEREKRRGKKPDLEMKESISGMDGNESGKDNQVDSEGKEQGQGQDDDSDDGNELDVSLNKLRFPSIPNFDARNINYGIHV